MTQRKPYKETRVTGKLVVELRAIEIEDITGDFVFLRIDGQLHKCEVGDTLNISFPLKVGDR